jgi:DNA-binding NtrC family response regulator
MAKMGSDPPPADVLFVEDDEATRDTVSEALSAEGYRVVGLPSGGAALRHLERCDAGVVLLDLGLPDMDGLDLLPKLKAIDESTVAVVMTGRDDIATVVDAMKRGAESFLVKPVDMQTLLAAVAKALEQHRLYRHASAYRQRVASVPPGEVGETELVGSSAAIRAVRELIATVAPTDASVVIRGESGVGKGVVARLLHRHSRRPSGPFVDLSCAALPANLVESEIFGYEPGAFTGAKGRKPGLLEVANGGTLFLDEVAELELPAQGKLLKVIEEKRFRRVGGVRDVSADVRFVVATHVDLRRAVAEKRFRQDLLFRLDVFEIEIPPLRERGDDVLELAYHFVRQLNPHLGRRARRLADPAARALLRYSWPGNVRELHNVMERALILTAGEEIRLAHLPADLRVSRGDAPAAVMTLEAVEARHVEHALRAAGGNVKRTAGLLGISRSTLYAKMERYGLQASPSATEAEE